VLTNQVKAVAPQDVRAAIDAIVLAFVADPMTRWTWPQPHQYLGAMPDVSRAFGGGAFTHGGADCTDGCSGAALWLPPGVDPDKTRMEEIFGRTASPAARRDMPGLFGQMESYHPRDPHWYLPLIGVDPARQGQGLGDALMTHACARCDRDKLPAYLESSNPRNISLYRRHGFEEIGTIQSGSSPTVVPMLRRPR
jgi:ribosomal protein S18 acetylase RimI-like enzyme